MTNKQVAEAFADNKGFGSSLHMYNEGHTVYSYGPHFPIAHRTGKLTAGGQEIILFNSNSYSNTTAKHQSLVRLALSDNNYVLVEVAGAEQINQTALNEITKRMEEADLKAKRARVEYSRNRWDREAVQARHELSIARKYLTL